MASSSENTSPAAALSSEKKPIVLRSCDGETFELEEDAARMSVTVKNIIEEKCADDVIPLPNVNALTLAKVAEFCKRLSPSAAAASSEADDGQSLELFKAKFADKVKAATKQQTFDLIMAANYLAIKELLDLTTRAVADRVKDMSVEGMRVYFGIQNDYTAEEETKFRAETSWAFNNYLILLLSLFLLHYFLLDFAI